jgi:hypothetical protein
VEKLLRLHPDYTIEKYTEWMRKHSVPEGRSRRMVAALRKAGLPD